MFRDIIPYATIHVAIWSKAFRRRPRRKRRLLSGRLGPSRPNLSKSGEDGVRFALAVLRLLLMSATLHRPEGSLHERSDIQDLMIEWSTGYLCAHLGCTRQRRTSNGPAVRELSFRWPSVFGARAVHSFFDQRCQRSRDGARVVDTTSHGVHARLARSAFEAVSTTNLVPIDNRAELSASA